MLTDAGIRQPCRNGTVESLRLGQLKMYELEPPSAPLIAPLNVKQLLLPFSANQVPGLTVCFAHLLHKFSPFSTSTMISCYLLPNLFAFASVMVAGLEAPQCGARVFLRCDLFCTDIVLPHAVDLVGLAPLH